MEIRFHWKACRLKSDCFKIPVKPFRSPLLNSYCFPSYFSRTWHGSFFLSGDDIVCEPGLGAFLF